MCTKTNICSVKNFLRGDTDYKSFIKASFSDEWKTVSQRLAEVTTAKNELQVFDVDSFWL